MPPDTKESKASADDAAVEQVDTHPHSEHFRELAEELPEKPSSDKVQAAVKEQLLADDAKQEAQAKVKQVNASPDAAATPSGAALKKVASISDDTERGEAYQRERAKVRHGYGGDED